MDAQSGRIVKYEAELWLLWALRFDCATSDNCLIHLAKSTESEAGSHGRLLLIDMTIEDVAEAFMSTLFFDCRRYDSRVLFPIAHHVFYLYVCWPLAETIKASKS